MKTTIFVACPIPFNLHDYLEPIRIFSKVLTQTVRVPRLLDGAKYCGKVQRLASTASTFKTDKQICDDMT